MAAARFIGLDARLRFRTCSMRYPPVMPHCDTLRRQCDTPHPDFIPPGGQVLREQEVMRSSETLRARAARAEPSRARGLASKVQLSLSPSRILRNRPRSWAMSLWVLVAIVGLGDVDEAVEVALAIDPRDQGGDAPSASWVFSLAASVSFTKVRYSPVQLLIFAPTRVGGLLTSVASTSAWVTLA